jgi:hypothetical protein
MSLNVSLQEISAVFLPQVVEALIFFTPVAQSDIRFRMFFFAATICQSLEESVSNSWFVCTRLFKTPLPLEPYDLSAQRLPYPHFFSCIRSIVTTFAYYCGLYFVP